ncbi:MAG: ABC transporter permease subunit [Lentisphaeria bacterium]|nr:ABC transporter permease subunit [Lentisphaeria bacterium]
MKRFLFIAAIISFFCVSLFAEERRFAVGFDASFPPYGYVKDGQYCGFDLDLAREVAKRNNWKLVLKPINWDAKDSELNSGMIDCIWNGFTINGREHAYTWSDPYVVNEQVVMVMKNSPVKQTADLKGLNVAVQTDTPVQKALSAGGECYELGSSFKKLVIAPDYNNAVMMLESGSVDAVAMDIGVAKEKMKTGEFRILDEILMKENYGIGFRKGDTALRDAVQNTLLEMVADGSAAQISAKYFEGENKMALGKISSVTKEVGNSGAGKLKLFSVTGELLSGLGVSVAIFLLTLVFALPLGLIVAWGRMCSNPVVSNIFRCFISVMRGTPLMLQLLVWFFGPYYIFGIQLSKLSFCGIDYRFIAVIIGFSFNYAAYFAEIYRGGIDSIARGQYEAACVLGYSRSQTFFRIILPQVVKRILPPMTNEIITLVKDTSLAFSLSVLEMFTIAKQIASASASMMPFIVAGVFYYVFNFIVAGVMAAVEKKLNYYR